MKRWITLGGVRFSSTRPGSYRSECRRYRIAHMLEGTVNAQWELWSLDANMEWDDLIDSGFTLADLKFHADRWRLLDRREK